MDMFLVRFVMTNIKGSSKKQWRWIETYPSLYSFDQSQTNSETRASLDFQKPH